jgi:GNAT superfamily N-acetyltransferase
VLHPGAGVTAFKVRGVRKRTDARAMATLCRRTFISSHTFLPRRTIVCESDGVYERWMRRLLADRRRSPSRVAVDESGRIVGGMVLQRLSPGRLRVNEIFVETAVQKGGIGHALFSEAKALAKRRGMRIDLTTAQGNRRAHAWYERQGGAKGLARKTSRWGRAIVLGVRYEWRRPSPFEG